MAMMPNPSDEYLRNSDLTARPEQLQLMLYDGAIRFARQGADALERKDYETSCEKLLRAQRIVTQLKTGLRPEVQPALCAQLGGLYDFVYWRLVDANTRRDARFIAEALTILEHQRETWRLLLEKLHPIESGAVPNTEVAPRSDASAPLLCVEG